MAIFRFLSFRSAPRRAWLAITVLPFVGIVIAVLGPFGSYSGMPLWSRMVHFAVCFTIVGAGILEGSYLVARRVFAGNWPLWAALFFDLVLSLPAALIVYGSLKILAPQILPFIRFTDLIWQNYLLTVMVRLCMTGVAVFRAQQLAQIAPVVLTESWPLAERLPFALRRAPIVAVSAEDHYLRIYTTKGEALIHLTMAETVAVLGSGFQIHRSHWVNAAYIRDHRTDRVELTTGLSLPVSRHRRKDFEAWLSAIASST